MNNVLITGANRGIGLELTRQLLEKGAWVIATCRQPAKAKKLQTLSALYGEQLIILPLDVTDDTSVEAAKTAVSQQVKSLDILINNAGIIHDDETLTNFDPQTMQQTFDVNVIGVMRVAARFVDFLRGGTNPRMINISSQLGSLAEMKTNWGTYSYNSSKAALNMVTRKLARDLEGDRVTVIAIHPGWVQTDMGGEKAPVLIPDSAQGILNVADQLTLADTGKFYIYSGEEHPW